jgi:hypothetical protein
VPVELHIAPVTCRMQDATHVRYDSVCETGSKLLTATAAQVKFLSLCEGNFYCTCDPFKAELLVQLPPCLRVCRQIAGVFMSDGETGLEMPRTK